MKKYQNSILIGSLVLLALAIVAWSYVLPPVLTWTSAMASSVMIASEKQNVVANTQLLKLQDKVCKDSQYVDKCEMHLSTNVAKYVVTTDDKKVIGITIENNYDTTTVLTVYLDGSIRSGAWRLHTDKGYNDVFSDPQKIGDDYKGMYQALVSDHLKTILKLLKIEEDRQPKLSA